MQNNLLVWMSWLKELGGSYEPVRDLEEKKPHTDGRRNPDLKPRRYELGTHSDPDFGGYGIKPNGQIVRL